MLLALTILLILLAEPIFYSYLSLNNIEVESGMMKYEFIGIFVLSMYQLVCFLIKDKLTGSNKRVISFTVLMGLLYASTGAFKYERNDLYWSEFLRWGSICISAVIVGIRLGYSRDFKYINRLLPFFTITLTIVIAMVYKRFFDSMKTGIIHDESGLMYHNISYYMAYLFGLNLYWQFFVRKHVSFIGSVFNLGIFLSMLLEVIVCLMSGGRGGAVLLYVYAVLASYFLFRMNGKRLLLMIVGFIVFYYIVSYFADYFNIWDSAGFNRIKNLTEHDNRSYVYIPAMNLIRETQAMGLGLGGVFYGLGFYSHNIILDLLIEIGFWGTVVFVIYMLRLFNKLHKLCRYNSYYNFLVIVLLYFIVMHMFSGYWFVNQGFWFVSSVVFSIRYQQKQRSRIIS